MSIPTETRRKIKERANYACEYCGVSESDVGGELTIDHYQPQTINGSDQLENLVYACYRCNLYKSDYWVTDSTSPHLWNPRNETFDEHFWLSDNGRIYAITETAEFTIKRLRLNREPLVKHRRHRIAQAIEQKLITHLQNAAKLLAQTNEEQSKLLEEQHNLLLEQQRLLKMLINTEK